MQVKIIQIAVSLAAALLVLLLLAMFHKGTNRLLRFLILLVFLGGAYFYFNAGARFNYASVRAKRARLALTETSPIQVAVVWPKKDDGFRKGVKLAVEKINRAGGVRLNRTSDSEIKRKISLKDYVVENQAQLTNIHRTIAYSPEFSAVIGHHDPTMAIYASIAYQYNDLLFLAPSITSIRLTDHGFKGVFRTQPNDRILAQNLVHYATRNGLKRIVVLLPNDLENRTFERFFRQEGIIVANSDGNIDPDSAISIVFEMEYSPDDQFYYDVTSKILGYDFDAILLLGEIDQSVRLIERLRTRGVTQPFLTSDEFRLDDFRTAASDTHEPIRFVSSFPPASQLDQLPLFRKFKLEYEEKYNTAPPAIAAQGYEAIQLLVQAWQKAGTTLTDPVVITLKAADAWNGLYGPISFSDTGDVVGRQVWIKRISDGKIVEAQPPMDSKIPDVNPPKDTSNTSDEEMALDAEGSATTSESANSDDLKTNSTPKKLSVVVTDSETGSIIVQ